MIPYVKSKIYKKAGQRVCSTYVTHFLVSKEKKKSAGIRGNPTECGCEI